jgi:hypothetical protein
MVAFLCLPVSKSFYMDLELSRWYRFADSLPFATIDKRRLFAGGAFREEPRPIAWWPRSMAVIEGVERNSWMS